MGRPLAVLADDVTGAADAATAMRGPGAVIEVWNSGGGDRVGLASDAHIPASAVSTGSRNLSAEEAARRVRAATELLLAQGSWPMKKIDSLLRGHIGVEVDALIDVLATPVHVVAAPALPSQGRITRDGIQWHRNTPVSEGVTSEDPLSPVRTSNVREALGWTRESSRVLPVQDLHEGALDALLDSADAVSVIVDAESQADLDRVREACIARDNVVMVGASDLLRQPHESAREQLPQARAFLIASVSQRPEVTEQVRTLVSSRMTVRHAETGFPELDVPAWEPRSAHGDVIVDVLTTRPTRVDPSTARDDSDRLNQRVANWIAGLMSSASAYDCLIILGGDLVDAVAQRLEIATFRVLAEPEPGTVVCHASAGVPHVPATVVLRSGAFGQPDSLASLLTLLSSGANHAHKGRVTHA